MLHVVHMIQRRYPRASGKIVGTLVILSASCLALGIGLLLFQ